MSERPCAFNGGQHKQLVAPWGRSCRFCHKTWVWRGKVLEPTYREG